MPVSVRATCMFLGRLMAGKRDEQRTMAAAPTAVVSAVMICRRLRPMVAPGELGIADPCFKVATAGCRRNVNQHKRCSVSGYDGVSREHRQGLENGPACEACGGVGTCEGVHGAERGARRGGARG